MKDRLNGSNPHAYGVLVMLTSHDGEIEICREFAGDISEAMRACAAFCDSNGLLVSCVSSPATICNDIKRMPDANGRGPNHRPERTYLSLVGRTDLLHPRLTA